MIPMNSLLRPFRLRADLTPRQRVTAITLITFAVIVTTLSLVVIFALADLGRPSFLPWIIWFLFGVGPAVTAFEEYGVGDSEDDDEEDETPVAEVPGRPTPPRLYLVHSSASAREDRHDDHVRTAG